ncbi:MAG: CapA family protein, partial [Candidatus Limnocylindrales bacterium]
FASACVASGTPVPTATHGPSRIPAGSASPSAAPPTPAPTAVPTPTIVRRPLVPVTNFRAPGTETSLEEVLAVLAGTSKRYAKVEVVEGQRLKVLTALGLGLDAAARLEAASDVAKLKADLVAARDRLGFLVVDDIDPSVKALGWEGTFLFGDERVASSDAWPLQAEFQVGGGGEPSLPAPRYDPATAWTLVAGGDILLDRGVALAIKGAASGADFPFDGGTVKINSRCKDCSPRGWDLPRSERTGNAGAVRALLQGADLAIANFENPAPDAFRFHSNGTVFSANPALIAGLKDAGIDFVSLANNHIRDAGAKGILQTIDHLDGFGIAHAGAGANLAAARTPALLHAGGQTVAILGYDTIAGGYFATDSRAGSAPLTAANVTVDVAAARKAGADIVIVFPHWGTEYDPTPFKGQRTLAQAAIDAGADMVIGNHAHWAAGMEVYKGKPIWYALGNFVFDQTWSEPTMEGITLELTFDGARLVQIRMRPHLILDRAQPNFMDPAGSGAVVMGQVWAASKGLLDW